jgi:hypothetical protein
MTARDGLKILEETGYRQQEADFHRLEGIALVGLDRLEEAKLPFKRRCASLERSRQNPMNSVPRRASRGCGANKGGGPKRGIYWHQFMAGSPKASTPPI